MIEIKLTAAHFNEIIKKGFSLDMIFFLKMIEETDEDYTFEDNTKVGNILQTMTRKGLISEVGVLTEEGGNILSFLSSTDEHPKIPRKKRIAVEDVFDQWWKAYPPTDTFDYKGRKFKGTRALRVKKVECKAKIQKILSAGEYTIDDLVQAVKLEVDQKVQNSYKTGQNKLSYMQNSLTYLNQCTYEPFIDLVKAGHKVEEQNKQVTSGGVEI